MEGMDDISSLAKALACPQKERRDSTMVALQKWLRKREKHVGRMSELEMMKLWKGLFYCLWLADKQPVQHEIAQRFVTLEFKKFENVELFVRVFWKTMIREWQGVDKYRLDKFYSAMRMMVHHSLTYFGQRNKIELLSEIHRDEIMLKKPDGIRFHLSDIILDEVFSSGCDNSLSAEEIQEVLSPFYCALGFANYDLLCQHVLRAVFYPLLTEEKHLVHLNLAEVSQALFTIAADTKNLKDTQRDLLYHCYGLFKKANKKVLVTEKPVAKRNLEEAFNDVSDISEESPKKSKTTEMITPEKEISSAKNKKRELEETTRTPTPESKKKKTKKSSLKKSSLKSNQDEIDSILNVASSGKKSNGQVKNKQDEIDAILKVPSSGKKSSSERRKKLRFSLKDMQVLEHRTSIKRLQTTPVKPAASIASPEFGLLRVKSPKNRNAGSTPGHSLKAGLEAARKNTRTNAASVIRRR